MANAAMISSVRQKYQTLAPLLHEKALRCWAACEARSLGRGGISLVAAATELSRPMIQGRIRTYHFRPTTSKLVAVLRHLAETIDHPYTDLEERREICEFIITEAENSQQQIDLRLLKHGLSDFEQYWRGEASIHWKELIVSSMQDYYAPVPTLSREERKTHDQDHIVELIQEMSESGGSKEAVVEDWMTANEKKKTAFYDRLKELPKEWQRRFRALPDRRSPALAQASPTGRRQARQTS
jgi:hypothetical protein